MASTQQILQAVSGLQENVQGQLPVIPNNGNPGGAHNMASAAPTGATPAPAPDPLAWLQPSEYMSNVRQMLDQQAQRLAAPPTDQGKFNLVPRDGQMFIMPLTNDSLPMSPDVPIVPLRTQTEIMQNPDAPVIPQFMNPNP